MFQFGFSVADGQKKWFDTIEDVFAIRLKKAGGLYATLSKGGRLYVSVACESKNRAALRQVIKECFTDMFATVVKHEYLKNRIKLALDRKSYNLLLHTLVAFDRENERAVIEDALLLTDGLSLDGIFYFRLKELRKRWDEIAALATDNAAYLIDEDTLNELIRFLISAVSPKIRCLDVRQQDNRYNVSGHLPESEFEYNILDTEQLLLYLIDIAPLELRIRGTFTDRQLYNRLVHIFDAKRVEG